MFYSIYKRKPDGFIIRQRLKHSSVWSMHCDYFCKTETRSRSSHTLHQVISCSFWLEVHWFIKACTCSDHHNYFISSRQRGSDCGSRHCSKQSRHLSTQDLGTHELGRSAVQQAHIAIMNLQSSASKHGFPEHSDINTPNVEFRL